MATPKTDATETPKTKTKRTSYELLVRTARLYAHTKIEVLESLGDSDAACKARIDELKAILGKLGEAK